MCVEISRFIVNKVSGLLGKGIPAVEEQKWPEAGSVFDSSTSKSNSVSSMLKEASEQSSRSSVKRQEAAAELAVSQGILKVLEEKERQEQEVQKLEAEIKRRIADEEAAVIKRRLEREAEELLRIS